MHIVLGGVSGCIPEHWLYVFQTSGVFVRGGLQLQDESQCTDPAAVLQHGM